jgi:hypothetical protein
MNSNSTLSSSSSAPSANTPNRLILSCVVGRLPSPLRGLPQRVCPNSDRTKVLHAFRNRRSLGDEMIRNGSPSFPMVNCVPFPPQVLRCFIGRTTPRPFQFISLNSQWHPLTNARTATYRVSVTTK